MKKRIFFILLSALMFPAPLLWAEVDVPICFWRLMDQEKYVFVADMDDLNWREIRDLRKRRKSSGEDPKYLTLEIAEHLENIVNFHTVKQGLPKETTPFLLDPDGKVHDLPPFAETDYTVRIPIDDNLIGRYNLGVTISMPPEDMDGDGRPENIYLCAKTMMRHYLAGGKVGSKSIVFFNDEKRLPLEIGPVINTAKSRFGGGEQRAHRDYEMMVKYKNKPLPDTKVTVISMGGQWQKNFVTDEQGKFEIIPTDDRNGAKEWDRYVYIATHYDKEAHAFYATTFPTTIYKNRPEWRSKTVGFIYWAILGCSLLVLTVMGFVKRSSWRNSRRLVVFENHSIKRTDHTDDQA